MEELMADYNLYHKGEVVAIGQHNSKNNLFYFGIRELIAKEIRASAGETSQVEEMEKTRKFLTSGSKSKRKAVISTVTQQKIYRLH